MHCERVITSASYTLQMRDRFHSLLPLPWLAILWPPAMTLAVGCVSHTELKPLTQRLNDLTRNTRQK